MAGIPVYRVPPPQIPVRLYIHEEVVSEGAAIPTQATIATIPSVASPATHT